MLVNIASYNVRDEILLLVEFIFRGVKMCKFSTLYGRLFEDSFVNHLSVKLISSIKIIIILL